MATPLSTTTELMSCGESGLVVSDTLEQVGGDTAWAALTRPKAVMEPLTGTGSAPVSSW